MALDTYGTVFLPIGIYKVSGLLLKSGNRLIGIDGEKTKLVPNNDNVTIIDIIATKSCVIEGIKIDAIGFKNCIGVFIRGSSANVSIRDMWFDSLFVAVKTNNSYFININTCRITGSEYGFVLQTGSSALTISNCGVLCTTRSLEWYGESGLSLIGNCFEWKTELLIYNCHGVNINGNYFEDDGNLNNFHIQLGGDNNKVSGVSFVGNQLNHGANYGIYIVNVEGVLIEANNFNTNNFAIAWYQYDLSPKRAVRIGNNNFNIGGLGYNPNKIIDYLGSDFDSLNCNFNDNQIQPLLFFKQKQPQSITIGNEQGVLYWDGSNLKFKFKDVGGNDSIKTINML